ncbi:hypothetical protein MGYG_07208 [Nannizzia gypsea CBS 118893]|uniref:Protein kinase domain-containing protein n=1 Tax=Arthroderma gypseum (strain ATCC MYA-4604 / CBS 118893) TaxID=535722 RepID=E4V2D6_ARTGP|nr:hypothetical protein MGYG_07208 [Nannizzia gypsea CBS 118893]EFR04201.1 hypothetical protein MGYG_07208 [Nannizzia gypsea CBS 118893]
MAPIGCICLDGDVLPASPKMPRPIYGLLTKGKKVLINGRRGQYQVVKALKQNVFQASTATARFILKAVKAFSDMDGHFTAVHTVSKAELSKPTIKLGDLGAIIPSEGFDHCRLQGVEIRAPEIWKGALPTPPCQVWSVGVTLTHFFANRVIFGNWDQDCRAQEFPLEVNKSAWAIGNIIKLIGPIKRDEDPKYQAEFDLAEIFVKHGLVKVGSLEEELAKVNAPKGFVDFIHYILTIEDKTRPTAEQALQHPWLQGLT